MLFCLFLKIADFFIIMDNFRHVCIILYFRKTVGDTLSDKKPRRDYNDDIKFASKITSSISPRKKSSQNIDGTDLESPNQDKKYKLSLQVIY